MNQRNEKLRVVRTDKALLIKRLRRTELSDEEAHQIEQKITDLTNIEKELVNEMQI